MRARKRGQRSGCAGELRWRIRCMLTHGIALAPQAIRSLRMANDSVPVRTSRFARPTILHPCAPRASHSFTFRCPARPPLRKTTFSVALRNHRFAQPCFSFPCARPPSQDFTFRCCASQPLRKTNDSAPVCTPHFARLHFSFPCAAVASQDDVFRSPAHPALRKTSLFAPVRAPPFAELRFPFPCVLPAPLTYGKDTQACALLVAASRAILLLQARVAELADAADSKSAAGNSVRVRTPPRAPTRAWWNW